MALDHEKLQKTEEMGPSGHILASWRTLTLRMTSILSHSHQRMQEKAQLLNIVSA